MRNVPVVLVPLCIGLSSGFIVPSGIYETLCRDSNNINCNETKRREAKLQNVTDIKLNTDVASNIIKTLMIDKAKSNKLNEDLYKEINKKGTDINERSFVYIKQRAKKPLENLMILNIIPKERIDISKTNTSHLLNRYNIFDDFHRQYLLGRTYIDKSRDDSNLILDTIDDHCNTKNKNSKNCKKTSSNNKYQDNSRVSKEKGKPKPKAIKISNEVIYPIAKPNFIPDRRYNKINLEMARKQNVTEKERIRQNNIQLDRYGVYFCLNCIKKLKNQNLKNPMLIKKNCICRHEEVTNTRRN